MEQLVGQLCEVCRQRIGDIVEGQFCPVCGNPIHVRCAPAPTVGADGHCKTCGCSLSTEATSRMLAERDRRARAARRQAAQPGLIPRLFAVSFSFVGFLVFVAVAETEFPTGGRFSAGRLVLAVAVVAVCSVVGWLFGRAVERSGKRSNSASSEAKTPPEL